MLDSPNNEEESALSQALPPDTNTKHKCYDVLLTRRRAVRLRADRIDLLSKIIGLNVKTYIPPSMMDDEDLHHWHCTTAAFQTNLVLGQWSNWLKQFVALTFLFRERI